MDLSDDLLALAIPARGDDSAPVALYRTNLGRVYVASGDAARAEPLLRRSLDSRLRLYGDNDWRVATTRSLLGSALTALHRYGEAESQLVAAQRILKDVPGAQGREARANTRRLATLVDARRAQPGEAVTPASHASTAGAAAAPARR